MLSKLAHKRLEVCGLPAVPLLHKRVHYLAAAPRARGRRKPFGAGISKARLLKLGALYLKTACERKRIHTTIKHKII